MKKTPLYDEHLRLGGKIVDFAGWALPVQYSGIVAEHHAVRQAAGLFDVSHMGEVLVTGPEARDALQYMTCNDVATLLPGRAQYNAIINDQGGVVDDIIIYCYSTERYFVCVNASNTDKDFAWFTAHNKHRAHFENLSPSYGQIALQGPKSAQILGSLEGAASMATLSYFHFADGELFGIPVIVARTGYTGEDGFEIFVPWDATAALWNRLLEAGAPHGLIPAALGARDSLRLEACYPLHGHELSDEISAIESGLGWIVKPEKGEFIGRSILARQMKEGAPRALIGYFLDDAGIARQGDVVFSTNGEQIGVTTSGTKTPTIGRALGLALVATKSSAVGTRIELEVRGKRLGGHIVKRPFYKKPKPM